ncbi:MAG: hypothetical protein NC097_01085 [Clostridium sp.]|nr:glucose-1-phosphate thymidylyltransferase [Prevotella sp.]MCM1428375.1 hypothetical protein [Clostridium sp.]
MNVILFDTELAHTNLLPLTFTRPMCDLRIGISTIRTKWRDITGVECGIIPVEYLREKYLILPEDVSDCYFITGTLVPDSQIWGRIEALAIGEAIVGDIPDDIVAFHGSYEDFLAHKIVNRVEGGNLRRVMQVYDIFIHNIEVLEEDYFRMTAGRLSNPLPESNRVIGPMEDSEGRPLIFIEDGASVEGATLNTTEGPIYIGVGAQIMEGSCVRGPFALCRKGKVRMGAKIYGGCTFGPYVKVGGEVDNVVIFGYSNKAHDGYLGNAVIGEWCNIGAGVNSSNLKNDYSKIRLWNYATRSFQRTDLQFCGLIMGDHSKVGINCMFNTATVVGVGCNIHGAGFPRVFIPSFSEGSPTGGFSDVSLKKFYQIAERVMSRRDIFFDDIDRRIYEKVYEVASGLKGK